MKPLRLALAVLGAVVLPLATTSTTGTASPTSSVNGPSASDLLAQTQDCSPVSDGRYAMSDGGRERVAVCQTGSAYYWTSDMAIDCDGVATDRCNQDTDPTFSEGTNFKTSTGDYFAADRTQYFVIPLPSDRFDYEQAGIEPGNVAAVIYRDRVVYAVFADRGPQDIIGEASYATARALGVEADPAVGGTSGPVTFIVFPGVVPDPVENNAVINKVGAAAANAFLGRAPGTPGQANQPAPGARPAPQDQAPDDQPAPSAGDQAPPADATPTVDVVGQLVASGGKCVDVTPGDFSEAEVRLSDCADTDAETWTAGRDGTLRAIGGCLGVTGASKADGAQVRLYPCDGTDARSDSEAKHWIRSGRHLFNINSGKCLEALGSGPLEIRSCDTSAGQQWSLRG